MAKLLAKNPLKLIVKIMLLIMVICMIFFVHL